MYGHVEAFSDVPTSPHCTIFVVKVVDDLGIEVNMISKGQSVWTKHVELESSIEYGILTAATFDPESQTLCYFDNEDFESLFSLKNKKWKEYFVPILP